MDNFLQALQSCTLFFGVSEDIIKSVLLECGYITKTYAKNEILLLHGARASSIGILIEGHAIAQKNNAEGRSFTVAQIDVGGVFGDILAGSHAQSPVTVSAASACTVLYLPFAALMSNGFASEGANIVLQNLVSTISDKYFVLDSRLGLLLEKSLRTRIYAYIKEKAATSGSFVHGYTRQELADYLGCERSALCRELSRMKRDALIDFDKHSFILINPPKAFTPR